jgi:hypothetical protein
VGDYLSVTSASSSVSLKFANIHVIMYMFWLPAVKGKSELVVCFGELLIDFVPTVGGLSLADAPAFKKAPGGAPANVACGIAKLGGNAAFVGKVCHLPADFSSLHQTSNRTDFE